MANHAQPDASRPTRLDRRKARTRQALIDAAAELIATGRGDRASIQEITDAADIGFGSFYNHFDAALDADVALCAVAGGLIGLLRLCQDHPERMHEQVVDQLAEATLRLLGVPADEAARLAALPVPEQGSW